MLANYENYRIMVWYRVDEGRQPCDDGRTKVSGDKEY